MKLTKLFVGAFALSAMLVACGDDSASAKDTELEELSSSSVIASEATQSSSSITTATPCNVDGENNCVYGTLTDTRDGKTYKTVTIGDQTWMAENLNYAYTGVPYKVTGFYVYTSDSTSWCYEDDPANCTKYGRLYTWAAAQNACPDGWHLPSKAEFETLLEAVGGVQHSEDYWLGQEVGKKLKSQTGWTAYDGITNEDAFGFSALPAGVRFDKGGYYNEGYFADFWSSTEFDSYGAYKMGLYYNYDHAGLLSHLKVYGFSVRCLKD